MPTYKSALQHVASEEFLTSTWEQMYRDTPKKKRIGFGVDGQSLNDFNLNASGHISLLSDKILSSKYKPSPLKPFFIPKSNEKYRVICVPTVSDRLIQRAVLAFLNQNGVTLSNPISHGFIHGYSKAVERATQKATQLRQHSSWAYKADISAFFDRVIRSELDQIISKKIKYPSLHALLKQFITTELKCTPSERKLIESQGIHEGIGLRQGMPISPYLANLYLQDFDNAVLKSKIKLVRYADDLIAFGKTEAECKAIHNFCIVELKKRSLEIHDIADGTKTVIANPSEDIEFLGICISRIGTSYKLVISRKQIAKLVHEITKHNSLSYCSKNGIRLVNILQIIDSKISGYSNAYDFVTNKSQLNDLLTNARTNTLGQLFSTLGVDFEGLSSEGKKFLGLNI